MSPPDDPQEESLDRLAVVARYADSAAAQEHALVILAMRLPCWVAPEETGGFSLLAEPEVLPAVRGEIAAYDAEQEAPPPLPENPVVFRHSSGWPVLVIWVLLLASIFVWQDEFPWWVEKGASSSTALIEDREWWRPFTALFLHADAPHLIGNLVSGAFFGGLVARSVGALRGWPLILVCGTLGNVTTSLVTYPEPFVSIGASTAVFGALGILSGLGFASLLRHRIRLSPTRVAAPIIGGIVVLGLMGGGTPEGNTDVLGHAFGFLAGIAGGLLAHFIEQAEANTG